MLPVFLRENHKLKNNLYYDSFGSISSCWIPALKTITSRFFFCPDKFLY